MKARTFELELHGSSGSGKSYFIKFIMEACLQSKEWSSVRTGGHTLKIVNIRYPIPDKGEQ